MSFFRTIVVIGVAVCLLPSDTGSRSDLAHRASHIGAETATFCQRNPNTCAAGVELSQAFLEKAQYAAELASQAPRSYMAQSRTVARQAEERSLMSQPGSPGSDPVGLSASDRAPVWRQPAPLPPHAYPATGPDRGRL